MGGFFNDALGQLGGAVVSSAGEQLAGDGSFQDKLKAGGLMVVKKLSPLPETDAASKRAIAVPPTNGVQVTDNDTLPQQKVGMSEWYQKNKKIVWIGGAILVVGVAAGVIKFKGG